MVYNLHFFSLQNAVCFIILKYLVPVLFTFYIHSVLKLKKKNSGAKKLTTATTVQFVHKIHPGSTKKPSSVDSRGFGSWLGLLGPMHSAIFRKLKTIFSLALPSSLPTPSFLLKIILLINYTFLFSYWPQACHKKS